MCYQIQQSLFLRSQQITVLCLQFKSLMFGSRSCIFPFRRSGRLIAWSYRHYGCFGRSRGFTAGIIIIFNGRRDDGGIAAVDVTVTGMEKTESSVARSSSPSGSTIHTLVVLVGQYSVERFPDSAHTVTATCLSQTSVGAVPFAKYSV